MTAPRPDFAARYYPSGLVVEDVVAGFRSHRVVRVRFDSWDDAAMVLATNPWEHWLYDFGDGDGDAERRAFLVQRIAGRALGARRRERLRGRGRDRAAPARVRGRRLRAARGDRPAAQRRPVPRAARVAA